mgnify:CR=1 FL=1
MNETLAFAKAISDRNRLRAAMALESQGELCVCRITELLRLATATVSYGITYEDNFFDLCPGRPITVRIVTENKLTVAELKKKLLIRSLADLY